MTDLFGSPLVVGDEIIYTTGSQSNTCLERGTIVEITTKATWNMGTREVALIRTASGRKATNYRGPHELVSVNPIKQASPELFI